MGTRIEACPPGFEVISGAIGAKEPRIICANCKTVVFDPKQRSG